MRLYNLGAVDTLYTVRFREVSGLSSFKNFQNQTTGCGDIADSPVGYFILSHPVDSVVPVRLFAFTLIF